MTWFEELMGFDEQSPEQVRENCYIDDQWNLISKANGKSFHIGEFEICRLDQLRQRTKSLLDKYQASNRLEEVTGNVQAFHQHKENRGALFQVASQFNLLEMVHPSVTPEQGVGQYQHDATQGPACAIACGAATIYRNYFVKISTSRIGQSQNHQVDCLKKLGDALGNTADQLWQMKNGYALPSMQGLELINQQLDAADAETIDQWRSLLQVGRHFNSEVTLNESGNKVSQVYCSATPVAYSNLSTSSWQPFARLVLEAAYESTLRLALLNREVTGSSTVFLTLLGGGAFGNQSPWIFDAIDRALNCVSNCDLDIRFVSYGISNLEVNYFISNQKAD